MDCWTQLDDDWNRGLAMASAAERVEVPAHKTVDAIRDALRAELSPDYQAIWDADNKAEFHRTGRRKGKSHYLIRRKAMKTMLGRDDTMNPYILPTLKSVTLVIWPLMKRIVQRHFGNDAKVNETLRTIRLPVGGTMVCGGCETEADAKNWFGMAFNECTLDECGNYPDKVLVNLSDESLEPSLLDFGGDMICAGNPGLILRGRWYDQTKDGKRDYDIPLYTGDCRSNPFLTMDPAAYFDSVKKKHRWDDRNATFRRQYLGEWVEDEEGLVFPFTAANMIDALPLKSRAGGTLPAHQWRYVIGVDVGYVDSTAIAVLAAHPLDDREVIVRTEKWSQWLPDQLAYRLRELQKQYPGVIVMDTGGMGKIHAEELRRKFGMGIIAAEKRNKASATRIMRDDIRSARLVAVADQNDVLFGGCAVIGWDEDKLNPEEGLPDDCTHATLYAHSWQHHYGNKSVEPSDDSPQAIAQRFEDDIIAKRLGTAKRNSNRAASLMAAQNRR